MIRAPSLPAIAGWLLLAACQTGTLDVVGDKADTDLPPTSDTDVTPTVDTDPDVDTDTETETDADTDADSDTLPSSTAETGGLVAPGTGDTSVDPVEEPPPVPDVIVDCAGAGDFTTIQAAIDASVSGTKIGVQPCTYPERIDFRGKSLDVYGLAGAATTIVDGGGAGTVATFVRGESFGTRLAGLTLTGGRDLTGASAVKVEYARVILEDLVITGNLRSDTAIFNNGAMVTIVDTTIAGNLYSQFGAGPIDAETGSLLVSRSTIDCDGSAQGIDSHNATIVLDSSVVCAGGYGIFVDGGEIHARRSRIEGTGDEALHAEDNPDNLSERVVLSNVEVVGGDQGAYLQYMNVEIEQSTFVAAGDALELDQCREDSSVRNSLFLGGGACDIRGDGQPYVVEWNGFTNGMNCDIAGSFTTPGDPLFVAPPVDLHLGPGSPAKDAGDPGILDPDGSVSDLGRWGGPEKNGPP